MISSSPHFFDPMRHSDVLSIGECVDEMVRTGLYEKLLEWPLVSQGQHLLMYVDPVVTFFLLLGVCWLSVNSLEVELVLEKGIIEIISFW